MKWKNKGREFDHLGSVMKKVKKIIIFGAGKYGEYAYKTIKENFEIVGFADNSINKQKSKKYNLPIYSPKELMNMNQDFSIIIAMNYIDTKKVMKQLTSYGYKEDKNVFLMDKFIPLFGIYCKDEVYFPSISFLPTTRCNLRCKGCLNFSNYNESKQDRELNDLKKDIDSFFECVDHIKQFHISGGEPLMYSEINELIKYIGSKYRDKIFYFAITTNGTIVPTEECCKLLREYDVEVILDDYTETVNNNKKFNNIKNKLNTNNINYSINKADSWIDLLPNKDSNFERSEKELNDLFERCNVPWQELRNGKIYSCNYSGYAAAAGIIEENKGDYYDLNEFNEFKKKELVEFRLGYNKLGYVELCKKCFGYIGINPNIIKSAEQLTND